MLIIRSALVRETLNTSSTVKACVTFLRYIKPTAESKGNGETKEKPFLEMVALLDLHQGVNGFAGTAHGGFYGVVLDEVCGTTANMQAGKLLFWGLPQNSISRNVPANEISRPWRIHSLSECEIQEANVYSCCGSMQGPSCQS